MTVIYAHTETGKALEPQPAGSVADYIRFVGSNRDTSGWNVVEVPAGTQHCATDNGNGTFTNPTAPPSSRLRALPQFVVMDVLNDVFGDTRFLAVLTALAALNTDAWVARMKRFNNCGATFTRDQVIAFLTAARSADVPTQGTKITVPEITAVASDIRWLEA